MYQLTASIYNISFIMLNLLVKFKNIQIYYLKIYKVNTCPLQTNGHMTGRRDRRKNQRELPFQRNAAPSLVFLSASGSSSQSHTKELTDPGRAPQSDGLNNTILSASSSAPVS